MSDVSSPKDMADQDTHQHTPDAKGGETRSTDNDYGKKEYTQERIKGSEDSASACTERETISDNCEEQVGFKTEEKMGPFEEASSSRNETSALSVVDNSTLPQADDGSHDDHNSVSGKDETLTTLDQIPSEDALHTLNSQADYHTGRNEATETHAATMDERRNDKPDGPNAINNEKHTDVNNTNPHAENGSESSLDVQENTPSEQVTLPQKMSDEEVMDEQRSDVETIGPATRETPAPAVPEAPRRPGGNGSYLVAVAVVVFVAILVQHFLQPEYLPQEENTLQIKIFLKQMEELKIKFPNQRSEFWTRSKIHLLRHLQTAKPTEPVSLILTSGVRAESTLSCLAQGLAAAFSSALNASVLHINGAGKAGQDSEQVKLDIDSRLQGAFEGDKPVAIIHRFDELPPGSALIFYRYCDHENAAFKRTFLIFTVLLEEDEIPAKSRLSTVEEMVDDQLQRKFLSDGHPVAFNRMDLDKYSGLWSRISHLILPVTTEERLNYGECKGHE